jgi:hypothetical protein
MRCNASIYQAQLEPGKRVTSGHWLITRCRMGLLPMLLLLASCQGPAAPTALATWTQEYVEQRWGQPPTPRPPDYVPGREGYYTFGWDASGRFYAVPDDRHSSSGVTIVDRVNARWCTLGTAGVFRGGNFGSGHYVVGFNNQYGWSSATSLDLSSWEVTITTWGACYQWMSCHRVDPPETQEYGYCDPDKNYWPGGMS